MRENPLVSIIIPTYNRAHLIGETLDSVLAQTYTNWECIVVDDGSSDNTNELLQEYCKKDTRFQYHHRPAYRPKGANACRNYGFELSKGEYINWFDSDDLMHFEKLNIQVTSLLKSGFKFSICQTLNFNKDLRRFYGLRPVKAYKKDPFKEYLKEEFVVFTPSTLWAKFFLIDNVLSFNETLQASQEWEFYCKIFSIEKLFYFVEQPLVFIRYHDNRISTTNPKEKFWNYFRARHLIYKELSKSIHQEEKIYLINYFVSSYKVLMKRKNYKYAVNVFFVLLLEKEINVKRKFFLVLSFFTNIIFDRGEILIVKTKL
ncbi:glycosyltransferase [Lutibacter holmesii]|uniref:Glycosyltransferase n=1 Tax=Lutibacter holmesii TaxID=1137985 RepID=A0ABW3WPD7_9FLAO